MKRIIIAVLLLFLTIGLNYLSQMRIEKYCADVKDDLTLALKYIDDKDYEKAKTKVNRVRNNKTLVAYIYNLDFKKIKKELDDAENLIEIKEYKYAKILIMRSISLTNDIYDEYSFFSQVKMQ